jgi:hypothetical protein
MKYAKSAVDAGCLPLVSVVVIFVPLVVQVFNRRD